MRKRWLLAITVLFGGLTGVQAQSANGNDTEITVTDNEGKKEVFDVPEGMEYDLDDLLRLYNTQNYLMEDTTCVNRNVNPSFPDSVYIDRLRRLPTIIEMPYNEVVKQFIQRYSGKLRSSVSYMLGASNFYMPIFEQALEAYNLPLELRYLPVIESALNPNAVSRVGASGLWQFMLETGKRYGLRVTTLVDERRDPVKASYAAARYLRDLYKIFDDWSLVIAAYNCGPNKVNQAIHRANGVADYWQIYPYLPKETRGYVPAFIAANYIMNYYCEHNICPMVSELPVGTDTIVVNKDLHLQQVSNVLNLNIDHLRALNPQYRHDIVNGLSEPMALRLPVSFVGAFIDNEDSIYNFKRDELLLKRDVVAVNNASPSYTTSKSTAKKSKTSGKKVGSKYVTVRKGDTLSTIAKRNGTTVKRLRQLNGIKNNTIKAGTRLRVK